MVLTATLFNDAGPFEQTVNITLTERRVLNLAKSSQMLSEDKAFTVYTILHMYIAQGQGQKTLEELILL